MIRPGDHCPHCRWPIVHDGNGLVCLGCAPEEARRYAARIAVAELCVYRETLCSIASGGKDEPQASRKALAVLKGVTAITTAGEVVRQ